MDSRREFIRKSIYLSGVAGLSTVLPGSIEKALAIDPAPGSTYLDAEHVVILMQENRSFDHCFGSLQGVRGFNDPTAFRLPGGHPVWFQTNKKGETFLPFRLDLKNSKATWMGALPHSRKAQVDAHNKGRHDQWLRSSHLRDKRYANIPFTLGYYNRADLPFNYALADAFTICDQHFSSAMTSTWPNRLYMWSGNIRSRPHDPRARAYVRNDLKLGEARWTAFPERLEAADISWRIYQNDLGTGGGYKGEERDWLSNFTCNTLEYFQKYHVQFSARWALSLKEREKKLKESIPELEADLKKLEPETKAYLKKKKALVKKKTVLEDTRKMIRQYSQENFEALSPLEKNLYRRAFTINEEDPHYRELDTFMYQGEGKTQTLQVPKGDILYRFRKDVQEGKLPAVSWLVPPKQFSDHPSAPWYGAWMISEVMHILTQNPEVWKKTIFILTYDENDGYFDHIPPFMPPDPTQRQGGKCSEGIDIASEYISREQEMHYGIAAKSARTSQIGLGYRVPMIVASPWSRGGRVNSQVFDHTSSLQFLEHFIKAKWGKSIREDNISAWRRCVCGDLRSVFTRYDPKQMPEGGFISRQKILKEIHQSQFKPLPNQYKKLDAETLEQGRNNPHAIAAMPRQEPGTRPACALPYELYVDGRKSADGKTFLLDLRVGDNRFGKASAGAPFTVYTRTGYRTDLKDVNYDPFQIRRYAVSPGDKLEDTWQLRDFKGGKYHLEVRGPNGFLREFKGNDQGTFPTITCKYARQGNKRLNGDLDFHIQAPVDADIQLEMYNAYQSDRSEAIQVKAGETRILSLDLRSSKSWYDIRFVLEGSKAYMQRYAGKVETGKEGSTDPRMGRLS